MDQTVGIEGVATLGDVEAILESFAGGHVDDPLVHRACLFKGHAVLAGQRLFQIAVILRIGVGIELEAAELHSDIGPVIEALEGVLEPALADVAPGSNDVRPDLYLHLPLPTRLEGYLFRQFA
jgi:hypothetical protein